MEEEAVRSKFIEEWRVLHLTVQDIRAHNADADPDEIQRMIDESLAEVRAERRAERRVKERADKP